MIKSNKIKAIAFDLSGTLIYYQGFDRERNFPIAFLYPDVIDTLTELKTKGYILGIISNASEQIDQQLIRLGISDYFSIKVFSGELGFSKPDPRIYQKFIVDCSFKPGEILMVGDSLSKDVQAAKKYGMKGVLLARQGNYSYPDTINSLTNIYKYL